MSTLRKAVFELSKYDESSIYRELHLSFIEEQRVLDELKQFCVDKCKNIWNVDFNGSLEVNRRLKSTMAQTKYIKINHKYIPKKIEISPVYLALYYKYDIICLHKILLHELCHYSLAKLGKPFFDGDPYFENELLRVNAISSGYINVNRRKADTGTQFRIYDIMDIYDSSDNIIDTIECTHQKASYDNVYTSFSWQSGKKVSGYPHRVGFRVVMEQ